MNFDKIIAIKFLTVGLYIYKLLRYEFHSTLKNISLVRFFLISVSNFMQNPKKSVVENVQSGFKICMQTDFKQSQ